MPLFPGTAKFIDRVIFHPCARPWFFYLLTAIPAAIKAIATVRFIDVDDLMREGAEEFAEGGHGRSGRHNRHSLRGLLEDDAGERKHWSQKGVKWALAATVPFEYFGMAILLLGAADRFFYDWQALLLSWRYCEGDPDSGPFQMERVAPSFFIGAYQMDTLLQNRSSWAHNTVQVTVPPGDITAILTLNAGYQGSGTAHVNTFLRADFGGFIDTERSEVIELRAGQSLDMLVSKTWFFPFGGAITWGVEGDPVPTGYPSTGGRIMVMKSTF